MLEQAVYILCSLTSASVFLLLVRAYAQNRTSLLLWSSICFLGFALENALVYIDLALFPDLNLRIWRLSLAFIGTSALVYGLVWESR